MKISTFNDLGLINPISQVLEKNNYIIPTPIQLKAIPILIESHDLLGIAQTGTGKTAAFALPLLQHLFQSQCNPVPAVARALILAPTRELAIQIADNCKIYGENLSLRQTTIFGGVSEKSQIQMMSRGVDLLIATPGRLLDLMEQGHINLSSVAYLVLDEADRMLDMGFIRDIKKIIAKIPKKRHTMLFSATMPDSIAGLANSILNNPKTISITPEVVTVEKIKQTIYMIDKKDKRALLVTLLQDQSIDKAIVFSKTKHGANRIVQELEQAKILSLAIHGNKSQAARQKALETFKNGEIRVLVATDIAARGIDVDNISHVINYDLPNEPESYVHRIGRTARAGAGGIAFSFCDDEEVKLLRAIEKTIKIKLNVGATPTLIKMAASIAKPAQVVQNKRTDKFEKNEQPKKGKIGYKFQKNKNSSKNSSAKKPENQNRNFKSKPSDLRNNRKP